MKGRVVISRATSQFFEKEHRSISKDNHVTIIKDGELINTEEDNLSIGDMVVVQTGDIVPADLKLVEASGLEIDEFEITGEIMPVIKKVDDDDVFIYSGSRVIKGKGKGIVVAKGEQTEYRGILKLYLFYS